MVKKKKRRKAKVKTSKKKKTAMPFAKVRQLPTAKIRQLPDLEAAKRDALADFDSRSNTYYRGSDNKWHRRITPK